MLQQSRYKASEEVDFVIIGSGAAGGVLAKELSTNGFRVVVLEQGPYLTEVGFTHNEIAVLKHHQLTNHRSFNPLRFAKLHRNKPSASRRSSMGGWSAARASISLPTIGGSTKLTSSSAAKWDQFPGPASPTGRLLTLIWSRITQKWSGKSAFRVSPTPARSIHRVRSLIPCRLCR